jgi:RHS repeat-associated protein
MTSAGGFAYAYDGDGNRTWKAPASTPNSPSLIYWYGGSGNILQESDGAGNGQFTYVHFNGRRATRMEWAHGGFVDHYGYDTLGNARWVYGSNASGAAAWDLSDYYPFGAERVLQSNVGQKFKFTGKERDSESGLDYFGARHYAPSMGRFMTPDPAGIAFSVLSAPQSWNLYSYVQNNPLKFTDPDGRECVWDDGSFDSKDDASTGSYAQCSAAGGHYFDPSTFTAGGGQDWSSQANQDLADFIQRGAEAGPAPDISRASSFDTSTTGQTTTINFSGINWFGSQWRFGNHPFRDNNPGDILSGGFTNNHGSIGNDGRFAVFPTSGSGQQALDSLLHGPGYINLSIDDAVARYAPAMENNTAGYQQFLQNVVGVSRVPRVPGLGTWVLGFDLDFLF